MTGLLAPLLLVVGCSAPSVAPDARGPVDIPASFSGSSLSGPTPGPVESGTLTTGSDPGPVPSRLVTTTVTRSVAISAPRATGNSTVPTSSPPVRLPTLPDPCPGCRSLARVQLAGGGRTDVIGGAGKLWLTWHDGSGRLVGVGPVPDAVFAFDVSAGLGCDRAATYCLMSYTQGMHGNYVQLFRLGANGVAGPIQRLEGVASEIHPLTAGLLLALAVPTDGTVLRTYWETWLLTGSKLVRRGCTAINAKAPATAASGPCPPVAAPTTSTGIDVTAAAADSGHRVDLLSYRVAGFGVKTVQGNGYWFSSPSGNIACVFGDTIICQIKEFSYEAPAAPSDCATAYGDELAVSYSDQPKFVCHGESVQPGNALPFGSSIVSGSLACLSTQTGMKCSSLTSGRGFILARAKVTLY